MLATKQNIGIKVPTTISTWSPLLRPEPDPAGDGALDGDGDDEPRGDDVLEVEESREIVTTEVVDDDVTVEKLRILSLLPVLPSDPGPECD